MISASKQRLSGQASRLAELHSFMKLVLGQQHASNGQTKYFVGMCQGVVMG